MTSLYNALKIKHVGSTDNQLFFGPGPRLWANFGWRGGVPWEACPTEVLKPHATYMELPGMGDGRLPAKFKVPRREGMGGKRQKEPF